MKPIATLALVLTVLVGCGRPPAPATRFHIDVQPDASSNHERRETLVLLQTPPQAEISIETGGQRSSMTAQTPPAGHKLPPAVRLTAERQPSTADGKPKIKTLIRLETPGGGYAGGPSTFTLEHDTPLTELLDVTVQDGGYPLNTPVQLGTHRGEPVILTVRSKTR